MISVRCLIVLAATASALHATEPTVQDPRLQLDLIASDPEIVTPIGLAIDSRDRLFVLESHTHEPPADYDGPEGDVVKIFAADGGDGSYELIGQFAEGIQQGMTLAFGPEGDLFAMTAGAVLRLPDRDGDDRCDSMEVVLKLEAPGTYPHNRLLAINFDSDGWMYVGRGNLSGEAWSITGPDGREVGGYGDGGSLLRCRPDGTQLTEIATGFWNPFALEVDRHGHLLCVDNDPDARGPNRVVHVVGGGDYGYKALYGGGGNHPYQGWDGELPGTLPIASGTGEAPCDLLAAARAALPGDYIDSLLVTVWNENTIERHVLQPAGSSIRGQAQVLISGEDDFRPVCIKTNSRGEIFFTDWVKVDYPNHGRGRIWRLRPRDDSLPVLKPSETFEAPQLEPEAVGDTAEILEHLSSEDPFVRHDAVMQLVQRDESGATDLTASWPEPSMGEPRVVAGYLLAMDRRPVDDRRVEWIGETLAHPDPQVRQTALLLIGKHRLASLKPAIPRAIDGPNVTPVLLETYLATLPLLEEGFIDAITQRKAVHPRDLIKPVGDRVVKEIVRDADRADRLRLLAAEYLSPPLDDLTRDALLELATSADESLLSAAIRQLGRFPDQRISDQLIATASNEDLPAVVRADAVAATAGQPSVDRAVIADLLFADEEDVAVEAARVLQHSATVETVRSAAQKRLAQLPPAATRLRQQLEMLLGSTVDRPADSAAWKEALARGGDPHFGRRVFFSAQATCTQCHALSGTVSTLGPNLGHIAQSLSRRQLVEAVIDPSAQFAPQYQAWQILDVDGNVYLGLQLDHIADGGLSLITPDNKTVEIEGDAVEDYRASKKSLMPEGLVGNLTVEDARDLISFLETLK